MGCAFNQELKEHTHFDDTRRNRLSTVDCRRKSTKIVDAIVQNVKLISETLNDQQIKFCIKNFKEHPLFSSLQDKQLKTICSKMVWMQTPCGQYLFHQGQAGHSFFLIQKGRLSVQIDGKKVTQMKEGQSFGELALLFRASRAASIKCIGEENKFFVMKPFVYRHILQQLKTAEYSRNKQIIQKIGLFQCLTNKQKYSLSNAIKQVNFKSGEVIFEAGQVSQGIYIVSEGSVQINLTSKPSIILKDLEVFGQSALKDNGRRQGQAKCKEDTKCLVIGKKDIEKSLGSNLKNLVYFNIQKWALLRSKQFNKFNNQELNKIILGFECIDKIDGQKLNGNEYKGLVIGLEGGLNNQPQGTLFNLKAWQDGKLVGQNLVKNGNGCIGYISFEKISQVIRVIQSKQKLIRASQKCIAEKDDNNLTLDDFQVVKKLGEGQFGQVFLVKNTKTGGGLYAVKCLSKKAVRQQQMELSVIEQKKILQKAIFPYIVGFVKAYHDKQNIFLLMEYIRGKEMFDVIRQMPTLNKPIARYYFGCILLAIQYLHLNNIIYRDVKPQNSVIDAHGKVYLIDMGTAKELNSKDMFRTFTIIGTPHYMAPEVFEGKGYSFEADYWSLGILLFQFICGKLPFGEHVHNDPYGLYSIIKKGKIEFPKYVTDDKIKNLISFMLVKDPKQRSQQVSFQKIKRHQFFQGFSWQDLLEQKILPPYVPRDFRSGKTELDDSSGQMFMRHLYGCKHYGKVQNWNESNGV